MYEAVVVHCALPIVFIPYFHQGVSKVESLFLNGGGILLNNIFCRSWQELVKTSVEVDPTQKLSSSRFTPCTHRYEEHILYIYI